jgi:hypothetical protein
VVLDPGDGVVERFFKAGVEGIQLSVRLTARIDEPIDPLVWPATVHGATVCPERHSVTLVRVVASLAQESSGSACSGSGRAGRPRNSGGISTDVLLHVSWLVSPLVLPLVLSLVVAVPPPPGLPWLKRGSLHP